ncbi:BNR-4 repeat-containing protein [Coraliomargarita sp. W4R72]
MNINITPYFQRYPMGGICWILLLISLALVMPASLSAEEPLLHNGGAVYLWVDSNTLEFEVFRRDHQEPVSRWDTDREMVVRLFDPSRELVGECIMPSPRPAGKASAWSSMVKQKFEIPVDRAGVYLLLVTMKRDSYFSSVRWGVKSNARGLLVDASAGHRDAKRIEPIEFLSDNKSASIIFKPKSPVFALSATDLVAGKTRGTMDISLVGGADSILQERTINNGSAHAVVQLSNQSEDSALLKAQLPVRSGKIVIAGVTNASETATPWMPLWAPTAEQWFDLESTHWLLRPRYQVASMGSESNVLQIRNIGDDVLEGVLIINDESQDQGIARDSIQLKLNPHEVRAYTVERPKQTDILRTRISFSSPDLPTSEATIVYDTKALSGQSIDLPFQLKPFRHDPASLGVADQHLPDAEVYFAKDQSGWYAGEQGLFNWKDGAWTSIVSKEDGIGLPSTERIFTDDANRVYSLFRDKSRYYLIVASASGGLLSSLELPKEVRGRVVIETNTSTTGMAAPPLILAYEKIGKGPRDSRTIWGVDHRLTAFVVAWEENDLVLREQFILSEHCIGLADHSGRTAPVASMGNRHFVAFGETSPSDSNDPGVPTYIVEIDPDQGEMGAKKLVGYAPPTNDVHNVSSVLVDSEGYLHVLLGAHNESFNYTRSNRPFGVGGWSPPEEVAPGYDQTYVGAVIDQDDTIHLVSRIWRRGTHFPEDPFDTALIQQRLEKNQDWSSPELLILPPLPHYGVYYHRLTLAPNGDLHLAWTQWPTWAAYRNELPDLGPPGSAFGYLHWVSVDGGRSWRWTCAEDYEEVKL